jgi:hypothetical protein
LAPHDSHTTSTPARFPVPLAATATRAPHDRLLFFFSTPCSTTARPGADSVGRGGPGVTPGACPCSPLLRRTHATTRHRRMRRMLLHRSIATTMEAWHSAIKA